jgi:hypothetical protein
VTTYATEGFTAPTLQPVESYGLHSLLGEAASSVVPVSGIALVADVCYLVFRDRRDVVRCRVPPPHPGRTLRWFRQAPCTSPAGYAGLTFDPGQARFYTLVDGAPAGDGAFWPGIDAYDDGLRFIERRVLDYPLKGDHAGFTGFSWIARGEQNYLLALCGGYKCKRGKAGRQPGGGRIHVFRPGASRWEHVRRINLPESVQFERFGSLALHEDHLLVVSLGSPEVWVGQLASDGLDLADEGTIYELPHDEAGDPLVGAITAAAWMNPTTILAVANGPSPQLHVLSLPA